MKMFYKLFLTIMNSYFILSVVSILSAVLIVALKVCYASKCDDVTFCWGLIHIEREVSMEDTQLADSNRSLGTPPRIRQMKILKNNPPEDRRLPVETV